MAALWPVFGLLVLTVEWVVLRRWASRLRGRSVGLRALVGAAAGLGLSAIVAALGLLVAVVSVALNLADDARQVAAATTTTLFVTGVLFAPVAAAFGAVLLAVERYRAETYPPDPPPGAGRGENVRG